MFIPNFKSLDQSERTDVIAFFLIILNIVFGHQLKSTFLSHYMSRLRQKQSLLIGSFGAFSECFDARNYPHTHSHTAVKPAWMLKQSRVNTAACYCNEWRRCFSDRCKASCNSKPLVCTRPAAHRTVGDWGRVKLCTDRLPVPFRQRAVQIWISQHS